VFCAAAPHTTAAKASASMREAIEGASVGDGAS
jgi:hypothetical protein